MVLAIAVFTATLLATYGAAFYARSQARDRCSDEDLAGRSLNRWLVGLSAATTGNSGFIVTAAVGLGYAGGVQWIMLPVAWFLGDLVFWSVFPERINRTARAVGAATLSEMLIAGVSSAVAKLLKWVVGILLVSCLCAYTSAQWLAGEKFLSGALALPTGYAAALFGFTIVLYSCIGNFRGGVYADTVQAIIRILGTVIALGSVAYAASENPRFFWHNVALAGPAFLTPFPQGGMLLPLGFVLGYAAAAIGFGLGQPQIVTRYMAGVSPEETRSARWIYISFLHGTWIAMTVFGVVLRGVMPGLRDPEMGLSVFVTSTLGSVATGIIFADVFATIASTANGILVAVAQIVRRDFFGAALGARRFSLAVTSMVTLGVGLVTIGLSFVLTGSVFSVAVASVSQIGAGLAGAVMIKSFGWRHSSMSLLLAIVAGIISGLVWSLTGLSAVLNEAAVGIAVSLMANRAVVSLAPAASLVVWPAAPEGIDSDHSRDPAPAG